jgi:hypothetical protein
MKLTNKDKKYLLSIGYTENDFEQISNIAKYIKYEMFTKEDESIVTRISRKKANELLGRNTFLSGLGRTAFHQSAVRYNDEGTIYVVFDSSKFFNN